MSDSISQFFLFKKYLSSCFVLRIISSYYLAFGVSTTSDCRFQCLIISLFDYFGIQLSSQWNWIPKFSVPKPSLCLVRLLFAKVSFNIFNNTYWTYPACSELAPRTEQRQLRREPVCSSVSAVAALQEGLEDSQAQCSLARSPILPSCPVNNHHTLIKCTLQPVHRKSDLRRSEANSSWRQRAAGRQNRPLS